MSWSKLIRQIHRWLSILFTVIVAAIFIALAVGMELAQWLYYLPLPPLFLLLFTGLYLFVLPYAVKWRGGDNARGFE
ncbi:MAG: hypothetical protein KDJ45_08705 [Hyphomicrobiaceae bacterium]|nr:hypothetical protein [Hyphomicrobiaceae bacterium]